MKTEFFEFSNSVKILAGDAALEKAFAYMHRKGGKNIFLISDKTLEELGYVNYIREECAKSGYINIMNVYTDVNQTPTNLDIEKVYLAYRESSCDGLLALGGSQVINTAKGLNLLLATNSRNVLDYRGIDCATRQKNIPFGIISTTFGSGREVSRTAIIIDAERKIPVEYVSDILQPDYCVLNSRFLKTLPEKEIFMSLIDVLAYDIEAYISLKTSVIAQSFAKTSMFVIKNSLQSALQNKDEESLYNLQRAAALSGIAYSNTFVGLIHAMAHSLTAKYNIPHCAAICCVMCECLEFNRDVCAAQYEDMLLYSLGAKEFATLDDNQRINTFINIFRNLINFITNQFEVKTKLSDYGIKESDLEPLADLTMEDGALLTCPKVVTKQNIMDILKKMM